MRAIAVRPVCNRANSETPPELPDGFVVDTKSEDRDRGGRANFLQDMRAYFAEEDGHKRDEIAARQLHALRRQQPPREEKLSLSDANLQRLGRL